MRSAQYLLSLLESAGISYRLEATHNDTKIEWETAVLSANDAVAKSLFIGIAGSRRNGGIYVQDAISKLSSVVLIEEEYEHLLQTVKKSHIFCGIIVRNAREAMIAIVKMIREKHRAHCKIIGVTGSAGKTTTKNLLYTILDTHQGAVYSIKNLNTVEGMSLSILNAQWEEANFGVFECGISEPGEMKQLIDILDPDYALITNVGVAHLGGYENIEMLRQEKLSIAECIDQKGILWLPEDDPVLIEAAKKHNIKCNICTYGKQSLGRSIMIEDKGIEGLRITMEKEAGSNEMAVIQSPLVGAINERNILSVLQVAEHFTVPYEVYFKVLKSFKNIKGRYEVLLRSPLILDDSYNASPQAVKEALLWMDTLENSPKIFVLGGMKELGKRSFEFHKEVVECAKKTTIDCIILIGEEYTDIPIDSEKQQFIKFEGSELSGDVSAYITEFFGQYTTEINPAIIFKGSRFYKLEEIANSYMKTIKG